MNKWMDSLILCWDESPGWISLCVKFKVLINQWKKYWKAELRNQIGKIFFLKEVCEVKIDRLGQMDIPQTAKI